MEFGHFLGRVPVLLVDVHQDCFLGLACTHKLILCFWILALYVEGRGREGGKGDGRGEGGKGDGRGWEGRGTGMDGRGTGGGD